MEIALSLLVLDLKDGKLWASGRKKKARRAINDTFLGWKMICWIAFVDRDSVEARCYKMLNQEYQSDPKWIQFI